jgi:short-subunit dehydrogenase
MSKVILVTGKVEALSQSVYVRRSHVAGANTGIGYELVNLLAQKGHKVYLGARNEAAGREAA